METAILDIEKMEEEVGVVHQTILAPKNYDWVGKEVVTIILKCPTAPIDLCGKSSLEWVKLACALTKTVVIDEVDEENLLLTLRDYTKNGRIIMVLYADTPLIETSTLLDALDMFSSRNMRAMAMPRGYIFSSDYIKDNSTFLSLVRKRIAPEQFVSVRTASEVSAACEILYQKIRDFHKESGVILLGEQTIFIDADVQIAPGVVIEPCCIIKGKSVIDHDLHSFSRIEDKN